MTTWRLARPGWLVVAAVAAFWALVFIAGAVNPGYRPGRDYISALASRGADQAWLGVAALIVLPMAHLAAAALCWPSARPVAVGLLFSAAAGLAVAADRISCPYGAAGCSSAAQGPRHTDWMDAVHGRAVAGYGIVMVVVLALAAYAFWDSPRTRGLAVASGLLAPASGALLAVSAAAADPGLPQRLWLAVNTGWLVGVAVVQR